MSMSLISRAQQRPLPVGETGGQSGAASYGTRLHESEARGRWGRGCEAALGATPPVKSAIETQPVGRM